MSAAPLFYAGALGFAGGIFFRSFFDITSTLALFLAGLAVLVVVLSWQERAVVCIALALIGFGLGVARYNFAEVRALQPLEGHSGSHVTLVGIVTKEPDERSHHTKLAVSVFDESGRWLGRVLVNADLYPRLSYGDEVRIAGVLKLPEIFDDDGRVFDYKTYLRKEGICCVMYYPNISLLESGRGNLFTGTLLALKAAFLERVSRVMPEPAGALLSGLVVGAKRSLGEEHLELFRQVGIIHIVVLSGYNLLIVARFLMEILSRFTRRVKIQAGVGAVGIVLFAVMTGASATTVRASAMALLSLAAKATSRLYLVVRALVFAGLLMLIVNPYLLVFDASFQLSFLATVGLIFFSPWFEKLFSFLPERFGLREIAAATTATQIAVLPLLLYQTGLFSLVSLPVNLLILPVIPLTMLIGFIAGSLGFISTTLSALAAYPAYLLLSYIFLVSEAWGSLPFAAYDIGLFPLWALVAAYAALAALVIWKRAPCPVVADK